MEKDRLKREVYRRLGQKIQGARDTRGWTQAQLADFLKISRTSVTNIERGRQHIQIHLLYGIAFALQIDVTQLLPIISAEEFTDIATKPSVFAKTSADQSFIADFLKTTGRERKPKTKRKTVL